MPAYMQLNSSNPARALISGPQAAAPRPALPKPAPALRGASAGFAMPGAYTNPMQSSSPQQQQQWRDETASKTAASQDASNAEWERNRQIQIEREMATAHKQNAVNSGGTAAGEYGYAYPGGYGGGGSRSAGSSGGSGTPNDGGAAAANNQARMDQIIASLTQQTQAPVEAPARIAAPQVPQASGMFAHAKDVSGRVGNKALEAFRNLMTKRGMSDSGMEAEGEANILGQVANQQAGAEYDQANLNNERQWSANQQGYQGDMGQNQMGYQGAIQQRGQGLQALLQLLNMQRY